MKKMILVLALLLLAVPAQGVVNIYSIQTGASDGPGNHEVTIYFDASSEASNRVRAFALDVTLSAMPTFALESTIQSVTAADPNYYVYPGEILIDSGGNVTSWGNPVAAGGVGYVSMTLEMGSLYAGNDPVHKSAPAKKGTICSFTVNKKCQITLAQNTQRGGVVMEDGTAANVTFVGQASPGLKVSCRGDSNKDGKVKKDDMGAISTYLQNNASSPTWTVNKISGGNLNPVWDSKLDANNDNAIKKNDIGAVATILQNRAVAPAWTYTCP